jgi:hypothetical protein
MGRAPVHAWRGFLLTPVCVPGGILGAQGPQGDNLVRQVSHALVQSGVAAGREADHAPSEVQRFFALRKSVLRELHSKIATKWSSSHHVKNMIFHCEKKKMTLWWVVNGEDAMLSGRGAGPPRPSKKVYTIEKVYTSSCNFKIGQAQ